MMDPQAKEHSNTKSPLADTVLKLEKIDKNLYRYHDMGLLIDTLRTGDILSMVGLLNNLLEKRSNGREKVFAS